MVSLQPADREIYLVDVNSGYTVNELDVATCSSAVGAGSGGDPTNMTLTQCINQPGPSNDIIPDGIHPNLLGDKHIADQLFAVLNTELNVCDVPLETIKPETIISAPLNDGDTITMPFTVSGTATDEGESGFARTRVAIENNNGGGWYQFDGTFNEGSPLVSRNATLSNTTVSSTEWELELTQLPPGDYTLFAITVDNAGNNQQSDANKIWTERQLSVQLAPTLITPANGSVLSGASQNFTWSDDELGITDWWLYAGSSPGESQYYNSGRLIYLPMAPPSTCGYGSWTQTLAGLLLMLHTQQRSLSPIHLPWVEHLNSKHRYPKQH